VRRGKINSPQIDTDKKQNINHEEHEEEKQIVEKKIICYNSLKRIITSREADKRK
jgi:hypothetical protein